MALRESDEPVIIALDFTGVKSTGPGNRWSGSRANETVCETPLRRQDEEAVSMEVSTDDIHKIKAFQGLLEGAEERRRVSEWFEDGAYDMCEVIKALEERGIETVCKPWRNSVLDLGSSVRERAMRVF